MYASLDVEELAQMKIAGMQLDHAPGDEMALHVLKEVNEPLFSRVMNTRAQIAGKVSFLIFLVILLFFSIADRLSEPGGP